jgi:hypothetical protein
MDLNEIGTSLKPQQNNKTIFFNYVLFLFSRLLSSMGKEEDHQKLNTLFFFSSSSLLLWR